MDPQRDRAFAVDAGGDAVALLAAEYVQKSLSGELLDLEQYLARLDQDSDRTRFRSLVAGAERVSALLPRQVHEGRVLSGRYRIDAELGAGGMGKVFQGFDLKLKRKVAVKVLGAFDTVDLDMGELFSRESELLASLQHPGIVAIHEAGRDGDVLYIVMDLVEGVSLNRLLERLRAAGQASPSAGKRLREVLDLAVPAGRRDLIGDESWGRTVARVMAEVVRTLEAAHGEGVVHRDLKPGNVMLRGDGSPVVLDFGLGGRLNREASAVTRRLFGSAAYVAPEQVAQGQAGSDVRSDIYQLGLLLYELLTLKQAFSGDDISNVLSDIGEGRFAPPRRLNPQVPVELEAICLMAMELRPERRYQTARELRTDLELFLSGLGQPRAMRGGRAAHLLRDGRYFVRRHKKVVQIAAATLVGTLLAVPFLGGGAPRVRGITYNESESAYTLNPQAVRRNEYLGVLIESEEPFYLYAYGLHGDATAKLGDLELEPLQEETRSGYESRWEAGEHKLIFNEARRAKEGIVVFALPERNAGLRLWLESLEEAMKSPDGLEDLDGVSQEFARKLLNSLVMPVRGGPNGRVRDPEEMRQLRKEVNRSTEKSETGLFFESLDPLILLLNVRD